MFVKTRNSSKDTEKIALICKYVNMPGRGGGTKKIGGAQKMETIQGTDKKW